MPNVVDLVNKRYKDKDDLLKHLLFMEKQFHESLDREKKLQQDLSKLQESHDKVKNDLKKEKKVKTSYKVWYIDCIERSWDTLTKKWIKRWTMP